jgi:hypothetical protein
MSLIKTDAIQTLAGKPILNSTGSVLQVVSTTKTDSFSAQSASLVDITGLSVTITPSASSSKILIMVQCHIVGSDANLRLQLVRGSTEIYKGSASGSRGRGSMVGLYDSSTGTGAYGAGANHIHFLDSPNTTSATTYKLQGSVLTGSATFYIGRTQYDGDNLNATRVPSTITVMEIAG